MRKNTVFWMATLSLATACASSPDNTRRSATAPLPPATVAVAREIESASTWFRAGAVRAHGNGAGRARARNIILFVGDGMSLPTVAAARIFEGQLRGEPGEENSLNFETLPYTALSKTYNTDSQTPDSAGTMSAMMTGAKTRKGVISVAQTARRGDCAAGLSVPMTSALELAEAAGLATGVVTNTRITHATPAAAYAHTPERRWESDRDMPAAAKTEGCRDIARQLIEFGIGDGIEVAMGGGRNSFMAAGEIDPEYPELHGGRLDGRHLVAEWQQRHPEGRYVWKAEQLEALDLASTPRLFGLFEPDHMNFEHDRPRDRGGEPSLAEMTRAAITVLKRHAGGFFLVIEGGLIDRAHHGGNAYRALTETVSLSDAVRVATTMTSDTDTLIIVTADHSHTLSFVGYPQRGNPILGKVVGTTTEDDAPGLARDNLGLPFTTLNYTNGPGYAGQSNLQPEGPKKFPHNMPKVGKAAQGRPDLHDVDTQHPDYMQEAMFPASSETHGGDDVAIWARGPGADAVRGTVEQNTIFHFMVQSQPAMVKLLCDLGNCENGVPMQLPALDSLRTRK